MAGDLDPAAAFLALGGGDLPAAPFFAADPGFALPGFLAGEALAFPLLAGRFFPLGDLPPTLVSLSLTPLSLTPLAEPGRLLLPGALPLLGRAGPVTRTVLLFTFFLPKAVKNRSKCVKYTVRKALVQQ